MQDMTRDEFWVSTHSRLKEAGFGRLSSDAYTGGFNTQPPEGGWAAFLAAINDKGEFQHTAA